MNVIRSTYFFDGLTSDDVKRDLRNIRNKKLEMHDDIQNNNEMLLIRNRI